MTQKTILILFPNEWDHWEFDAHRYRGKLRFIYEGFDLHKFPENARLMTFSAGRFIERIVAKYRNAGLVGVLSNEEQFGAVIAAVIAERLGLPGVPPAAILTAQHKFYARERSREVAPEATPAYTVFSPYVQREEEVKQEFPLFVKPVKATYSILAKRVDNFAELKRHLTFKPLESWILKKLIQPAEDLAQKYTQFPLDAHHILGEEVLDGMQVTVDGYVHDGVVKIMGVVDSIMYPGTNAFQRFEYPSSLPEPVQEKMGDIVARIVKAFGLNQSLFNVEFFYNPVNGDLKMIEMNPRMAYQFADLYEKVDGFNPYDILVDLTLGRTPKYCFRQGACNHAASFVLRAFPGSKLMSAPDAAHVKRIREQYPDARIMVYLKKGNSLAREYKWLGSYRYAVFNLGAKTSQDLHQRYHQVCSQLPFVFT
ncbi:MAG: ATP-grasp domain-containing protein [Pseudomonadota bacterium]|nr:ATP-grasp domain-containing protein [Pseudomonadota bacterium]